MGKQLRQRLGVFLAIGESILRTLFFDILFSTFFRRIYIYIIYIYIYIHKAIGVRGILINLRNFRANFNYIN